MSEKLALSAALSVLLMAAFALYGTEPAPGTFETRDSSFSSVSSESLLPSLPELLPLAR